MAEQVYQNWIANLVRESERTGRPIQMIVGGIWTLQTNLTFSGTSDLYRVEPEPPAEPKFRPLNYDELCQFASKPNAVRGKSIAGKFTIGPLTINDRRVCIGDLIVDPATLIDCSTGELLRVEIKD